MPALPAPSRRRQAAAAAAAARACCAGAHPPAPTLWVHVRPPSLSLPSSTSTLRLFFLRIMAVVRPEMPAPMTMTSYLRGAAGSCCAHRRSRGAGLQRVPHCRADLPAAVRGMQAAIACAGMRARGESRGGGGALCVGGARRRGAGVDGGWRAAQCDGLAHGRRLGRRPDPRGGRRGPGPEPGRGGRWPSTERCSGWRARRRSVPGGMGGFNRGARQEEQGHQRRVAQEHRVLLRPASAPGRPARRARHFNRRAGFEIRWGAAPPRTSAQQVNCAHPLRLPLPGAAGASCPITYDIERSPPRARQATRGESEMPRGTCKALAETRAAARACIIHPVRTWKYRAPRRAGEAGWRCDFGDRQFGW
jgi:hypothetical protein